MSTSSLAGPFRLLPDHIRAADDRTGDLDAFLTAAWAGGMAPALQFLTASDPDVGPAPIRWADFGVAWDSPDWTWVGHPDAEPARTSHPVDPAYSPAAWLPWLARLMGADITGLTDEQARWYLARRGRSAVGSEQGIKDAVAATLSGARAVTITTPSTWEMTITVDAAEVLDSAVTLAVARRNKPSGVRLTVTTSTLVTLADIDAGYTDLAEITSTGKTLDQLRFG